MSGEIEVPETPNWLQELEAKRERRLKARLGHEAGAGAPCLKCGEKCPGLDLHFWRKCCKICKCSKEEHEVQDDDIYGWAQFQLLGSKPNKIKRKIILPGKKDALELDWTPKGHNDTVDKYLKTLPPEQLPVKGSQAAQDRKQLLQKQIPIHDIDPTLCHELSNDELKQMNDYISHVKQASVGVGQIVSLSNIIKAHLHTINPSEAALIASRYPKGIPLAEIVKLQSQSRANPLKQQGLNEMLDKLQLQDPSNKALPNLRPNSVTTIEENLNPWVSSNVRDINYPGYTKDINQTPTNPLFATRLMPGQNRSYLAGNHPDQNVPPTLDDRFLQNPNFDPKNIPSQFVQQTVPHGQPYPYRIDQPNIPIDDNLKYPPGKDSDPTNSAFVPYNKTSPSYRPGDTYIGDSPSKSPNYSSGLPGRGTKSPSGYRPGEVPNQNVPRLPGSPGKGYLEETNPLGPNFAKNLSKYPSGHKNLDQSQNFGTPGYSSGSKDFDYGNVEEIGKNAMSGLPNYIPGKYNVVSEVQSPTKINKNLKDVAFGTYNPADPNSSSLQDTIPSQRQENAFAPPNLAYENYPPGHFDNQTSPYKQNISNPSTNQYGIPSDIYPNYSIPLDPNNTSYDQNSIGPKSDQYIGSGNPPNAFKPIPGIGDPNNQGNAYNVSYPNDNIPSQGANIPYDSRNSPHDQNVGGLRPGQYARPNTSPSKALNFAPGQNMNYEQSYPSDNQGINMPFDQNSSGLRPGSYVGPNNSPSKAVNPVPGSFNDQNVPLGQYNPNNVPYPGGTISNQPNFAHNTKPTKKLSELHPGKIVVDEDYLQPSQVKIGAIQDIDYPEIKAATQGTNDFYEDYSPDSLREILNNVKLPDCHYCKKPFEENEFAITIDRANVLFHAQCFKCAGCNQILADNVYFYNKETDNVYCGRDYAKVRGFPRCKACDELIFTKEYCLAENSTFHLKHFCCIECDKPLAGQDYTLEDEMPYCLPCFEHSKASKCSSCGNVIKPDEIGCNLNGVHFHAVDECFACKVCKKPLMGKKLLLRNEKLYCSHDCFGTDKK